jgi:glycosyltransferase involved in cell wall biosynthesis
LAAEFFRHGAATTIVTPQWEKRWPTEVVHRDVPIVRLPHPPRNRWGTFRYVRAVSRWLRKHHGEFDVAMVSSLRHEAYAAVGTLSRTRVPVVLRAEAGGAAGDCQWQRTVRFGGSFRRRCQAADAIVAPSRLVAEELREAGYQPERIYHVVGGAAAVPPCDPQRRKAARLALGKAHELLTLADDVPLVVYAGRLHEAMGLAELIDAWPSVLARYRQARLWIIGEGPFGEKLWRRIRERELEQYVILPGLFDDLTDVLHAADLFVQPSRDEGQSTALLEAMAAAVPIVATDTSDSREFLTGGEPGRLVPPRDSETLAAAIVLSLASPQSAAECGTRARRRAGEQFSLEQLVVQYLQLFEKLMVEKAKQH